ncbi:MAG TPA: DUF4437 domain-containing protein [Polyangiaceae bacterium]|nr:DUF4437 domain-containing protein [Polyangiaceae bacterium]
MTEKFRIRVNQALTALVAASVAVAATLLARGAPALSTPDISRTPPAEVKYQPLDPRDKQGLGPQIALVFGDMKKKAPVGFLFKVPPGFRPGPHTHTQDYYSVVLEGIVHDFAPGVDESQPIGPGGFWFQRGKAAHDNHCASTTPCVIFIYSPSGYDYLPLTRPPAG